LVFAFVLVSGKVRRFAMFAVLRGVGGVDLGAAAAALAGAHGAGEASGVDELGEHGVDLGGLRVPAKKPGGDLLLVRPCSPVSAIQAASRAGVAVSVKMARAEAME
jgi:hypothetical protein